VEMGEIVKDIKPVPAYHLIYIQPSFIYNLQLPHANYLTFS